MFEDRDNQIQAVVAAQILVEDGACQVWQAGKQGEGLFRVVGHGHTIATMLQGASGLFGQRLIVFNQQELAHSHLASSRGQSIRAWVQRGPNSISRCAPICSSVVLTSVRPIPMPSRSDGAWAGPSSLTCRR